VQRQNPSRALWGRRIATAAATVVFVAVVVLIIASITSL